MKPNYVVFKKNFESLGTKYFGWDEEYYRKNVFGDYAIEEIDNAYTMFIEGYLEGENHES